MCKSIKNIYNSKLTYENIYNAYLRAKKGKGVKKEIIKFEIDLETNLCSILNDLKNETYIPGEYRSFTIYEPKERVIKALPFRDRIVQQWYIEEFIKPFIVPRFINSSCACIEGKGTLYAVNLCTKYMRIMKRKYNNYFVLQLDIKKYFNSINKDILFSIMNKYISDKKLLNLTYIFIYSGDEDGICIGNYVSQYYANIYLNELDYYIKDELKIKYMIRYLDDIVILLKSKNECRLVKNRIEVFINNILDLKYNEKSRYYPSRIGINFCGYRIFETHKLLRVRSKKKIKRNIKIWNKYNVDKHTILVCWNAWRGHSKHANSYNFRCSMYNRLNYKEKININ